MNEREQMTPMVPLAPTLEPLCNCNGGGGAAGGTEVRATLDRLSAAKFRYVQLSASQPGLRPRDLDRSARRDLLATLRRTELGISGLDLWIPPAHFLDSAHCDRAVDAVLQAIQLAVDLGHCPISLTLARSDSTIENQMTSVLKVIGDASLRMDVPLANHAVPIENDDDIGIGIDPPAWLAQRHDPIAAVLDNQRRIVSARICDLLLSGMRGPIGNSNDHQLDWRHYKIALAAINFNRPCVVDARQWLNPWQGVEQTARLWNR